MYCLISYQKMVELGILESAGPKHSDYMNSIIYIILIFGLKHLKRTCLQTITEFIPPPNPLNID